MKRIQICFLFFGDVKFTTKIWILQNFIEIYIIFTFYLQSLITIYCFQYFGNNNTNRIELMYYELFFSKSL